MIGSSQAGWPGSNNGNSFIYFRVCKFYLNAVGQTIVTNEALHHIYGGSIIMFGPITSCLTGMITDPAHDRWKGIFLHNKSPGIFKPPLSSKIHVACNVFASRALLITG